MSYPAEAESFRTEVRTVLAQELPPGWAGHRGHRRARRGGAVRGAVAAGAVPPRPARHHLAAEYGGRGLSRLHQVVLMEELARAGVPFGEHTDLFGIKMLGSTLLRWGTAEQRRRFLPRILSGEDRWCQGFSEPGAGSDLAALTTRARRMARTGSSTGRRSGPRWRTAPTGSSCWPAPTRGRAGTPGSRSCSARWTSRASRSGRSPAHRGQRLQRGVLYRRPDPANLVVGAPGEGWPVAMTLLGHERGEEAATNPILFRAELDRLFALAAERGRDHDPLIRQRLAWCYARVEIMRYLGYRILTQVQRQTELGQTSGRNRTRRGGLGREAVLERVPCGRDRTGPGHRWPGRLGAGRPRPAARGAHRRPRRSQLLGLLARRLPERPAGTIYAGTSEVQRNILAESVLGLPKEETWLIQMSSAAGSRW